MTLTFLVACEEKHEEATSLLAEIRDSYENGDYQAALIAIDSLRRTYPEAISQRKEALEIFQKASIAIAQGNLADVDSMLQKIDEEYKRLKPIVEAHRKSGDASAAELSYFNQLSARRDSLQGVFTVECAKIRYIRKRQQESEATEK